MADNNASTSGDNSPIIGQNGVVLGDVSIYYVAADAPPEKKYEVALARLDGGMARFAEELLTEVLKSPLGARPKVLYHYLVASFSDRSLGDLLDRHEQALATARRVVASRVEADDVTDISKLRSLLELVDIAGDVTDDTPFPKALSDRMEEAYKALPLSHRRHLDALLAGPAKDNAFADYIEKIRHRRTGDLLDRRDRVWKFFEPDPAEPRDLHRPMAALSRSAQIIYVAGTLMFLVGLMCLATQINARGNRDALRVAAPLAVAGLAAGVGAGWRRSRNREMLEYCQSRTQGRPPGTAATDDGDVRPVLLMVNANFQRLSPGEGTSWDSMTAGLRVSLAREIVAEYDGEDVKYGRLRWLARLHAEQALDQWQNRRLRTYEETYRDRTYLRRIKLAGIILLVFTALILLGGLQPLASAKSLLPFAAAAGGLTLLWHPVLKRLGLRSAHRIQARWNTERLAGERARWEWWSDLLRNRPTDNEMATWLSYDVDVFKADVMSEHGIKPHTVVCTVELATGDKDAQRAREAFGPIRYDRYLLTVFLLTRTGLRQFQSNLDLASGELHNEARRAVPYGALREVQVTQESVRRARHNAAPAPFRGGEPGSAEPGSLSDVSLPQVTSDVRIYHRKFLVRLDSGSAVEIELGNFEDLRAGSEPDNLVARLALEATGVEVAQHVLESVVVDGTDWISREQARRRQREIASAVAPPSLDTPDEQLALPLSAPEGREPPSAA